MIIQWKDFACQTFSLMKHPLSDSGSQMFYDCLTFLRRSATSSHPQLDKEDSHSDDLSAHLLFLALSLPQPGGKCPVRCREGS